MLEVLNICRKNNGHFSEKFRIAQGECNLFAAFESPGDEASFYTLLALFDTQGVYELIRGENGVYAPCWRRMSPPMLSYMQSLRAQLKAVLRPYKAAANKEREFCYKIVERLKNDQLSELRRKLPRNIDAKELRKLNFQGQVEKALHNRLILNNLAKKSKSEYLRIIEAFKAKRKKELSRLHKIAPFYNFEGGYVDFKCVQHIDAFNACASTFC